MEGKSILYGSGDRIVVIDFTQSHDFANMMMRIHAPLCKFVKVQFSLGRQSWKAHVDFLVAGFFTLSEQCFWMVRVFEVLITVITANMACDQFIFRIDTHSLRVSSERQTRAGVFSRDRVAVSVQSNPELSGCSGLSDGRDIERMVRQGAWTRAFFLEKVHGFFMGFAVDPSISDSISPVLDGGVDSSEIRDVETG